MSSQLSSELFISGFLAVSSLYLLAWLHFSLSLSPSFSYSTIGDERSGEAEDHGSRISQERHGEKKKHGQGIKEERQTGIFVLLFGEDRDEEEEEKINGLYYWERSQKWGMRREEGLSTPSSLLSGLAVGLLAEYVVSIANG